MSKTNDTSNLDYDTGELRTDELKVVVGGFPMATRAQRAAAD